jgi:hypothetical protein
MITRLGKIHERILTLYDGMSEDIIMNMNDMFIVFLEMLEKVGLC